MPGMIDQEIQNDVLILQKTTEYFKIEKGLTI